MAHASTAPNKSTTVRTKKTGLEAFRLGFRLLGPAAPRLVARWAGKRFLTARRHPRPAWEHEVLESGRGFRIASRWGELPAWSWGKGPLVVLVHGWEGRGSQLGAFVAPLVEAGFRVVTFDAPGHGDAPGERSSAVHVADALLALLSATGPAFGVVAHSMGAIAATYARSLSPDLFSGTRHVYLAPAVDPRDFARSFASHLGLGDELAERIERDVELELSVPMRALHAPTLARSFDAPLLVVHDEDDREVPLRAGLALSSAWPGASLLTTTTLGHRRVLRDPDVIAAARSFLKGHAAPSRITPRPPALEERGQGSLLWGNG